MSAGNGALDDTTVTSAADRGGHGAASAGPGYDHARRWTENKSLVDFFVEELWNRGNLAVVDELCTRDYELHDPSLPSHLVLGRPGLKRLVSMTKEAFPDFTVTIDEQIASGDRVVTRVTQRGTHRGPFMGIPATGKRMTITATSIDRLVNGKLAESWGVSDQFSLMEQLGVELSR